MLHIRVDDKLKADAAEKLAGVGLTGRRAHPADPCGQGRRTAGWPHGRPGGLRCRFRAKVQEALADTRPPVPHQQVMDEAQALIDRKRRART